jgi:hypothetical protein
MNRIRGARDKFSVIDARLGGALSDVVTSNSCIESSSGSFSTPTGVGS